MGRNTSRRLSLTLALMGAVGILPRLDLRAEPVKPRTDLHGDLLPDGAVARYGTLRLRHATPVSHLAFSRDGKQLASVGEEDKSVRVWEIPSGKLLTRVAVRKEESPRAAAFGPDGTLFVLGSDPTCSAWDLKNGRRLFAKDLEDQGNTAAWAPDGKTLAVGLVSGKTVLLDAATGAEVARLEPTAPEEQGVTHLVFTPDGTKLAVGHADGMARLWDVGMKKRVHTFPTEKGAEGILRDVCFSPDGLSLIVATDDRVLAFVVNTGKAAADFTAPMANLAGVRFTPNGKQLVGLGTDGRVFHWQAGTGKPVSETKKVLFEGVEDAFAVFDSAATVAAYARETDIHLIDLRTGKFLHEPTETRTPLVQVRFRGQGEVLCRGEDGSLRFWNPATGRGNKLVPVLAADESQPSVIDLSLDGCRVAAVDPAGNFRVLEGKKELWKANTTEEGIPAQLHFSPDGTLLAACHEGGVLLLDAATGKRRLALVVAADGEFRVQWSRDGRMLAVADSATNEVTIWELATGRKRRTLEVKEPVVTAFTGDGRRLAVGCANGMIHVFEMTAEGATLELAIGEGPVRALVFSPDGTRLAAAGDNVVRLWDAEGKPLAAFHGHEGEVHDLAFAPDGRTLVSCSQDGTALVWDALHPPRPSRGRDPSRNLADLWEELGHEDAARAFRAVTALRETPAETVAFIKERLTPAQAPEPKRVARLLADLQSDDFATREKAAKELELFDVQVETTLRAALLKESGIDAKTWMKMLLEKLEAPPSRPERLREVRAVEVLEQIASPEACALLEALAGGSDARLTREAKIAVRRLTTK